MAKVVIDFGALSSLFEYLERMHAIVHHFLAGW